MCMILHVCVDVCKIFNIHIYPDSKWRQAFLFPFHRQENWSWGSRTDLIGHMRSVCQRRNTILSLEYRLTYAKSVSQNSPVIFLFFRSCLDFIEHALLHLIQITVSVNWRYGSKWKPRILIGIWGSFANQYSSTYPHRKD